MNTLSIKQVELYNLIHHINIQDIEKIVSFAKNNKIIIENNSRKSLAGIWSKLNFENIDLEQELKELRNKVTKNLDSIEL